jgi:flavodoxin
MSTSPSRRILVVFYSRDGHTRRIASRIAAACQADLEEITDTTSRDGPLGYLRSALEAVLGMAASVHSGRRSPQDYALVVVGTPVWGWNMSSPVRRYLLLHAGRLPKVACFCTHGSSGPAKVLANMGELAGRVPVASLALKDSECDGASYPRELQRFARELTQAAAAAAGAAGQRQAA